MFTTIQKFFPREKGNRQHVQDGVRASGDPAERSRPQTLSHGRLSRSETGLAVIGFAASILTIPRSARPENARAFSEALSKFHRNQ